MSLEDKIVITCAITGAIGDKSKHAALPVTPREIADSALEAHAAGAAVAHIHVRDPETAEPSMAFELYEEVVERIRDSADLIINLTTGFGARIIPDGKDPVGIGPGSTWRSPEKRVEHAVRLRPDICTLDVGSMNFGPRVFANIVPHVEEMVGIIREAGAKPELEVFDLGHIRIAKSLVENGFVEEPPLFQLCLGIAWGITASPKNMLFMKESLPSGAVWSGFGIGPASFPLAAQAVLLGGNVRVGFEDNFYLRRGVGAQSNAQLVERAVEILKSLDKEPASPREAREIFHLKGKQDDSH